MMMWHLPTGMRMELEPKDFLFYFESGSHKIVLAGLELNSETVLLVSPECCHHLCVTMLN